jgi:hypothetical protein
MLLLRFLEEQTRHTWYTESRYWYVGCLVGISFLISDIGKGRTKLFVCNVVCCEHFAFSHNLIGSCCREGGSHGSNIWGGWCAPHLGVLCVLPRYPLRHVITFVIGRLFCLNVITRRNRTQTNKAKPRTGFGSMLLIFNRTSVCVIVRIALCKWCFLNKWFVFHIVFFLRLSQIFFLTWICLTRGWYALHRSHRTL